MITTNMGELGAKISKMTDRRLARLRAELKKAVTASAIVTKAEMVKASPRFTGKLANSHVYVVSETPGEIRAEIFNRDEKKARWLHEGTQHTRMPPPDALKRWVIRKLGVPENKADGVAFLVARSILRKGGLAARKWMEKAFAGQGPATAARLRKAISTALRGG